MQFTYFTIDHIGSRERLLACLTTLPILVFQTAMWFFLAQLFREFYVGKMFVIANAATLKKLL
jgi:hypothetical protein